MGIRERLLSLTVLGALGLGSFVSSGTVRYRRWCSRESRPGPAEVVIVLGIRLTPTGEAHFLLRERVATACDLLHELPSAALLVTGGNPRSGVTEAARMKEIARNRGVPDNNIIVEPNARTTEENALFSADIMAARDWTGALLVSHRLHLGYAIPVFEDVFKRRGFELYWQPVTRHTPRCGSRGATS